jgi:hypothetical protein
VGVCGFYLGELGEERGHGGATGWFFGGAGLYAVLDWVVLEGLVWRWGEGELPS